MDASEDYKRGDLRAALAAQLQQVKDDPGHEGKRLFLFELLTFAGELDRAQRQIEALLTGETEHDLPFLAYRQLLDSERGRRLDLRLHRRDAGRRRVYLYRNGDRCGWKYERGFCKLCGDRRYDGTGGSVHAGPQSRRPGQRDKQHDADLYRNGGGRRHRDDF